MRGVRKEYSQALGEWGSRAEREYVPRFLIGNGYEYTTFPDARSGIDGQAKNDVECFRVEVERSLFNRWSGDRFKYPTVHILERRGRYGDRNWLHFTVREDGRFAVVTFPQSLTQDRLKHNPNKLVKSGEYAYDIPVQQTLTVDLSDRSGQSIAERNVCRIRDGVARLRGKPAMEFLGDEPPYGMSETEWRQLRDEAEKPIAELAWCCCKDQPKRRGPDLFGRTGWFAEHCCACGRWYGCGPVER